MKATLLLPGSRGLVIGPVQQYLRKWLVSLLLAAGAASAQAQTVVEYIHTDALGTPVAVTNSAGVVIERSEYEPYGKLLNRPLTDGPGFTGHVQDAATGLTYMQQRYYDPEIGKMLSVDPVTAYSGGDMRHFNVYAYAYNNPYKFTDPDGRAPPGCGDGSCEPRDHGNFWVGAAKAVRDTIAPVAHAIVDPSGDMIDPSYDRLGPGPGQVEQGGYKFGNALAVAEGARGLGNAAGGLAKGEVVLTEAQAANLARFDKRMPAGNTGTTVSQAGKGVTFTSEVPGKVPGSKAVYEKSVNASGTTTGMKKTTVDPNGQVVHIKDKPVK